MTRLTAALTCALIASPALAQGDAPPAHIVGPNSTPASGPASTGGFLVEQDTLVRLMVLNEVSTKTVKAGERFVLRVDEPVVVNGVTIIPAGAKAWGEVLTAEKSGAVGKSGKLSARLLYVEAGADKVPLSGENQTKGEKGTKQVTLGALGFGLLAPLALFAPGNNAKLKAGEIFTAYLAGDMLFDPATKRFTPAPEQAAPAVVVTTQ